MSGEEFDAFRQSLEDLRDHPDAPESSFGRIEDPGVCSLTTCNTIEESLQAMRLAARLCPLPRHYVLAVGGWCLLFVAIGLALLAASPNLPGRILSGVLILLPPLVYWKLRQTCTGMTREQLEAVWPREHLENPYHWTITPAGLRVAILQSWTLLPWDRIRTWAETDVGLVVVQAGDRVHFVPRRAADTADEWTTFVDTFHRWAPDPPPL